MSPAEFRQRHRAYGWRVPVDDVPAHLACGWRIVEDIALSAPHELLMAPPPATLERSEAA
jgi:hypothetical protein